MNSDLIDFQCRTLTTLKRDVGTLNADIRRMMPKYFEKTGLKTRIIFGLFVLKDELMTKLDSQLQAQFEGLKSACITHIDSRIAALPGATERVIALNSIQDIIFACDQVAKLKIAQLSEGQAIEVAEFQASVLPAAIAALGLTENREKIEIAFAALHSALQDRNFFEAQNQLNDIRLFLN